MTSVSVRVPGSTSNCGAGFDTLGLALQVYNTVTLTPRDESGWAPVTDSDARASGMVTEVVNLFQSAIGKTASGFTWNITGDVPPARGLGSSVTVLAGVLGGLNHWAGAPLDAEAQVRLLTKIEGHPDNAAAGVLGGFCVACFGETPADYVHTVRIEIPDTLKFVVVSPVTEVATKASRGVLPERISHLDAVRSVNSAACLTAAFASGEYGKLRDTVRDFLHEPHRLPGIAGGRDAIRSGIDAGALTGWLSGSGSSVLCLAAADVAENVGKAMQAAFSAVGVGSDVRELIADNRGAVVLE